MKTKDFCYVVHSTVEYYLHRRTPVIDSYDPLHAVDVAIALFSVLFVQSAFDRIISIL